MPRYFFDISDRFGWHRDRHGVDIDTAEEAREQAIALLPDIARDEMPDSDQHDILCEIRNAEGRVIYRGELRFRGEFIEEPGGS